MIVKETISKLRRAQMRKEDRKRRGNYHPVKIRAFFVCELQPNNNVRQAVSRFFNAQRFHFF